MKNCALQERRGALVYANGLPEHSGCRPPGGGRRGTVGMAAPRAYWRGTIRLSLVSVPVRLYAATSSSRRLSLHMIHEPTGERVRYQRVVPDVGPVSNEEIVKGYEYERGRYVTLSDEELEQLKVESKHTISLVRFVDANDIDPIYFDRPYFVAPDSELADEPFVVLRDALRATRKTALGQITLSGKEHIAAIRPCGRGLVLETLRYGDEVRRANKFFDEIPDVDADEEQLELAELLIEKKSGPFDPSEFRDNQQAMLRQMIEAKLSDEPTPTEREAREPAKVVNLMDALRRSVDEAEEGGSARGKGKQASAAKGKQASAKGKQSGRRAKSDEDEDAGEPQRRSNRSKKSA